MRERLFFEIKRRGLYQYEFAQRARLSESALSKIIRGRVEPSDRVKYSIARVLEVPIDELFPQKQSPHADTLRNIAE